MLESQRDFDICDSIHIMGIAVYKCQTINMTQTARRQTLTRMSLCFELRDDSHTELDTDVGQHQKICVVLLRKDMISDK